MNWCTNNLKNKEIIHGKKKYLRPHDCKPSSLPWLIGWYNLGPCFIEFSMADYLRRALSTT